MGNMETYRSTGKYKNYSLPTSKPLRSHALYKEKVWTLQEQIHRQLTKVAEHLESLYPKLTDDFSKNIKPVIKKNLEVLLGDLDLMQASLQKNPDSFNKNKLKTNQSHITEMKNVCNNLQTVSSYEYEFKNVGKLKHALNELEHLIQPTSFEKSLKKARAKSNRKAVATKKERILVEAKKKTKEKSMAKSKKQKAVSKKAKPATKSSKRIKVDSRKPKKSKAAANKPKSSAKKVAKSKTKPKVIAKKASVKTITKAKPHRKRG